MVYVISVSDMKNAETLRKKLNLALAGLNAEYASALPSAATQPDGKLFAVSNQLYQNQNNTWVAL